MDASCSWTTTSKATWQAGHYVEQKQRTKKSVTLSFDVFWGFPFTAFRAGRTDLQCPTRSAAAGGTGTACHKGLRRVRQRFQFQLN